MAAERWDEQVGSVADEAGRLLESLRRAAAEAADAAQDAGAGPDAGGGAEAGTGAEAGGGADAGAEAGADAGSAPTDAPLGAAGPGHDPFCTYCPLCRGAAVIRSLSPETLARLADLAALAATALADLAGSRTAAAGEGAGAGPASAPRRPGASPSRPIAVHDAEDPKEAPRG